MADDTRHSWQPLIDALGDCYHCIAPEFAERYGVDVIHHEEYGHWIHLENAQLVAGHLRDFLC